MNGYICFYNGKRIEIRAASLWDAKQKAMAEFQRGQRKRVDGQLVSVHVMLSAFSIRVIPDARTVRVVRDSDCEGFEVQRVRKGEADPRRTYYYTVYNRTHFIGGFRIARDLDEVRRVIRNA